MTVTTQEAPAMFDRSTHDHHSLGGASDNRLTRIGYGAASPLWLPFMAAAGVGVAFWVMTAWTRKGFGAGLGGSVDAPLQPSAPDLSPAPQGELAPEKLEQIENYMAHTPPPAESGAFAPEDKAPPPPVPAEDIMDHTPPETVNAPAAPEVERKIGQAKPVDAAGPDAGGEAGLLAETAATLTGETLGLGDVRADDQDAAPAPAAAADASPLGTHEHVHTSKAALLSGSATSVLGTSTAAEASFDPDGADMIDAAYAGNFGPVPTPASSGGGKSKKRKVTPGTAPGA
jgi:hypothetical protein